MPIIRRGVSIAKHSDTWMYLKPIFSTSLLIYQILYSENCLKRISFGPVVEFGIDGRVL